MSMVTFQSLIKLVMKREGIKATAHWYSCFKGQFLVMVIPEMDINFDSECYFLEILLTLLGR